MFSEAHWRFPMFTRSALCGCLATHFGLVVFRRGRQCGAIPRAGWVVQARVATRRARPGWPGRCVVSLGLSSVMGERPLFHPGLPEREAGGPGVSPGYWTAGRRRDRFRSVTGPGWLPGSCVPALRAAVSGWAGYWWLVAVVEFHSAAAPSVAG